MLYYLAAGERKKLTVLLLGETGVGKSTFINGFVNYLHYGSLREAKEGESRWLIPSHFTITAENFEERRITCGSDPNEVSKVGQSATQSPVTYTFNIPEITIRIIDTPGIGDCRGIEKDKENMQMIMSHLSNYDELHGICILLKPNNARLNVMFSFCIKELLIQLHKDACKNMIICFTNSRGTFYKPGDTLPALRELLQAMNNHNQAIDIKLNKDTIYCMDNESFRFLMAMKHDVTFSDKEQADFDASWDKSVDEYIRLVIHISTLKPHAVKDTLTLNGARRAILDLSRPIAEISKAIQRNIAVIDEKESEVVNEQMSKEELRNKLYIPAVDVDVKQLERPCTVCTARTCVKTVKFRDVEKIDYLQRCHEGCQIKTEINRIGCTELQGCWAMHPSGGTTCRSCKCPWDLHMHITYVTKQVTNHVLDENVSRQMNDKDQKIKAIEDYKKGLLQKKKELEEEIAVITKVSAQFACFLKANAIAPYNDAVLKYLDHLISVEEDKAAETRNKCELKRLRDLKSTYSKEIEVVQKAIDEGRGSAVLRPEDIYQNIDRLRELKHYGSTFIEMMATAHTANSMAVRRCEKVLAVEPSISARFWNYTKNKAKTVKSKFY